VNRYRRTAAGRLDISAHLAKGLGDAFHRPRRKTLVPDQARLERL
jgi:hypothetical protein